VSGGSKCGRQLAHSLAGCYGWARTSRTTSAPVSSQGCPSSPWAAWRWHRRCPHSHQG